MQPTLCRYNLKALALTSLFAFVIDFNDQIMKRVFVLNGTGDYSGLLAKLQFNTLFQGSKASDIKLDEFITGADLINAGYKLTSGDNSMGLDVVDLQHQNLALNNKFTINESYQDIVSGVGIDVNKLDNLSTNESVLLKNLLNAKDQISGVNLDEELANMIIYQRSYEANARMIATFSEMIEEILQIR